MRLKQSSITTSSSLPRISDILPAIHLHGLWVSGYCEARWWGEETDFFMTCRLTFCMSTFWLNSGGNLVLFKSLASTPVAMVGNRFQTLAAVEGEEVVRKPMQKLVTSGMKFEKGWLLFGTHVCGSRASAPAASGELQWGSGGSTRRGPLSTMSVMLRW